MKNLLTSLNIWRRLGVVLTVVWLVVVPPLFWISEKDGLNYNVSSQLDDCLERVGGLPLDADRIRSNIQLMAARGATLVEVDNYVIAEGLVPKVVAPAFREWRACSEASSRYAAVNQGIGYPVTLGWCALFAAAVWVLSLSANYAARWVWAGRSVTP